MPIPGDPVGTPTTAYFTQVNLTLNNPVISEAGTGANMTGQGQIYPVGYGTVLQ